MAYIVGQSFTIFNLGAISSLSVGGGAGYIMEMIMLTLILLSGIGNTYFKLRNASAAHYGRQRWLWLVLSKLIILIFLTPITDLIVISWVGTVG